MAAKKKTFDMDAVGKAALTVLKAQTKGGSKATVSSVIEGMRAEGSDIAPTRLAVLLKELSDSDSLGGFYCRRGNGFVHSDAVPRTNKPKAKAKAKKSTKRAKKAPQLNPANLAAEIDKQEEAAALEEYRAVSRAKARAALGLTG